MGENWLWVAIKKSKTDVQIGRKSRKMQQRENEYQRALSKPLLQIKKKKKWSPRGKSLAKA